MPFFFLLLQGTSLRTVERVIAKLRDMGFPIAYDKHRETYFYTDEVKFSFEMLVGKEEVLKIKGGEAYFFEKNFTPPNFGGVTSYLCVTS